MRDSQKTKAELLSEISELRQKLSESEVSRKSSSISGDNLNDPPENQFAGQNSQHFHLPDPAYREMFDLNEIIKLIIDPADGKILDANIAAVSFYGYDIDTIRTMSIKDINILPPEEVQHNLDMAREKKKLRFNFRHRLSSGEIRDVDAYTGPVQLGNRIVLFAIIIDVTEKNILASELQRREATYRSIIRNAPIGIFYFDSKGIITECNGKFVNIIGSDRETIIGLNMPEKLRDQGIISAVWKTLSDGEAYYEDLYSSVTADKQTYVKIVFNGIRDADGDIYAGVGLVEDIDERKRIENQLRASEEQYRYLVELSNAAIVVHQEGRVVFANPFAAKKIGFSSVNELIGKDIREFIHPDELEAVLQDVSEMLAGGTPKQNNERRYIRTDGETIYVEQSSKRIDFHGMPAVLLIASEVTGKKIAEHALQESEIRLRAIFENSRDAIGVSKSGVHVMLNPAYLNIFGYKKDTDLFGLPILECIAPSERKRVMEFSRRRDAGEEVPSQYETVGLRADGEEFILDVNVSFYQLNEEKYSVAIIRDITERKNTEEKLRKRSWQLMSAERVGRMGFIEMDLPGMDITLSDEIYHILNLDPVRDQPLSFDHMISLVHPEERGFVRAGLERTIAGTGIFDIECRMIGEDGSYIWVSSIAELEYDNNGQPRRLMGMIHDINERKQSENTLRSIATEFTSLAGLEFFQQVCRHLTDTLRSDIAFIGKYLKEKNAVSIKAGIMDGELMDVFEYELENAPCEKVVGQNVVCYPSDVKNIFPKDALLTELQIESYIGVPLFGKSGIPLGIIVTMNRKPLTDASMHQSIMKIFSDRVSAEMERIQAEKALVENERKLREAQKIARLGYYTFDMAKDTWTSSTELDQIIGIDESYQRNFKGWYRLIHPDFREEIIAYVETVVMLQHRNFDKEFKIICQTDHQEKWVHGLGELKFDSNDNPIGIFGTIQDITETKEAHFALLKSEENKRLLIESSPYCIHQIDMDGNLVSMNPAGLKILGLTEEIEVIGLPMLNFVSEADKNRIKKLLKKSAQGEHSEFEFNTVKKQVLTSSFIPLFDDNGKVIRIMGITRDITETRKTEVEKSKLEKQLRRAQKLETIGTLAGGIAHDFNNILTPIMGYTEMAMLKLGNHDPLYGDLDQVLIASKRAKDLINQILLFSKKSEMDKYPLSLQSLIKEALKLLRPTIPSTIKIQQKIDQNYENILADATQIHQVIVNLCTNAWQAMEGMNGVLSIELKSMIMTTESAGNFSHLKPGKYLCLSISDTGCGIEKKVLDKVFDPFFTTKQSKKGTGLGLSVAHGIILNHSGEIRINSIVGEGTTVSIYLPVIEQKPLSANRVLPDFTTGNGHILVVDDEMIVGEMIRQMLERLGYTVELFQKSRDVINAFTKNPGNFDLLVSDLTMPEMNGLELSARIQNIQQGFPVIIITGHGKVIDLNILEDADAVKVLKKPVEMQELSSAVSQILSDKE